MESGVPFTGRTLLRGTLFNTFQSIFTGVLVMVVATPLIIHRLGTSGYGIWALMITLGGWCLFLDAGISLSAAKFAGRFAGTNDRLMFRKLAGTIGWAYAGMAALSAIAAAIFVHGLLTAFVGHHAHPSDDIALALVFLFQFCVSAVRCVSGLLAGLQIIERAGKIAVAFAVLQCAAIAAWALLPAGGTLTGLAVIYFAATLAQIAVLLRLLHKSNVAGEPLGLSFDLRYVDTGFLRDVVRFGVVLYATQLLVNIMVSDRLYLGWIRVPLDQIAEYHIGALLVGKLVAVLSAMAAAVYPAASSLDARHDIDRIERLTRQTFRFYAFVGFFLFLFLGVHASTILRVWLGQPMYLAVQIVWLLSGWGLTAILGGLAAIAAGVGKPQIQLKSSFVALAGLALLYPALIRPFGAPGLAASITLSFVVAGLVFLAEFRKKIVRISISTILRDGFAKPLGCAVAAIVPLSLAVSVAGVENRAGQVALLAVEFTLSATLYMMLGRATGMIQESDMEMIRRR